MVQDIDIKSKRILLFDFDGTLIETASGNTFATDLTDMRIKMDVVNKALDLMQENGVKVFAIVSNQGGVEAGFVSGADIEAKIEYVLRSVHDLAVKRGIRGVLYEKRLCYSNDEQNPMRKPNTGMIDDILILENPYGVGLNIKITLKDFYKIETDDGKTATVDDVLNIRIDKDQNFNSYSDVIKIETLKDGSIKYTSLYHESKENSDSLS